MNLTLALGAAVFIAYNALGIYRVGIVNYLKHFWGPVLLMGPLLFVIELVSHVVRPFSLALRLRGTMYGDHLVLGVISTEFPWLIPIGIMMLGSFICFVQAYVFTMLTMVYVSIATHDEHAHEGVTH
jgi:F-type H+-transporting ATPase subunit a